MSDDASAWTLTDRDVPRPGFQHLILLVVLTASGTVLGCLGDLSVEVSGAGSVNVFWPASALIAVGGIWFGGWGILAGVLVGGFSGYFNASLEGSAPSLLYAFHFAPSDLVQGLLPALVFRLKKLDPSLPTRREISAFILWGVLLNRLLGGGLALLSLRLSGQVFSPAQRMEALALWLLAGMWPGLLFGIPLLKSLSSVLPSSSFFCKTWWGGSIRPRHRTAKEEEIPMALSLFFGFSLVCLLPLLAAGSADLIFSPEEEGRIHDAILPLTLNLAFFLSLIGVGRYAGTMNRRLGILQAGTRELGAGHLDHRIPDLGSDELGRLGTAFNTMAQDLNTSREELARSVAERARDVKEKEIAWEIQRGFLPKENPALPGYAFAASCVPARTVGGDFYGYVQLPGERLGLMVGDVSGKGIPAALVTGLAKTLLDVFAQGGQSPAEAVGALNTHLAADNPTGTFVTVVYGIIEPQTGRLTYTNAGHNAPALVRRGGSVEELRSTGLPVGMLPEAAYRQAECTLNPGDMLALYSDGVTEAFGPGDALYGDERLFDLLAKLAGSEPDTVLSTVLSDVDAHRAGQPPSDDTTLVLVRREA